MLTPMASGPWTDKENDRVVASYFAMLVEDLAGRRYSKVENNRKLQELTGRTHGSIEYKLQNVSAVLRLLGEVWIPGYKPAGNFQRSLVDAVERWLDEHPDDIASPHVHGKAANLQALEQSLLWIGPPPSHSNEPPPSELEKVLPKLLKLDRAGRDERNRKLGLAGEQVVLAHERHCLMRAGRTDLAQRVRWTSKDEGDGAGYDISSFSPQGRRRLIEVKTTCGWERTPFYLSRNEIAISEERRDEWRLLRLWNFAREPKAFELSPPLDLHVRLAPATFLASFR